MSAIEPDATELARRLRAGELTAEALLEGCVAAVKAVNPRLNAVVCELFDDARARLRAGLPDGPFAGVPIAVKDFDGFVQGAPFTASTRFLEGFVPDHDSLALARLRQAGFLFLCKTNLPELAILGTSESEWRGPVRNPWDPEHSAGGSSGGSGALVASGAVPLAHGGDGGGSLRIPASANGLVGLKCSRGRIPLGPEMGEGWGGYVQWGVLTRTVRDTAAAVDAMSGPGPGDPYAAPPLPGPLLAEVGRDPGRLRVALCTRSIFGQATDPECAEAAQRTGRLLQSLGHEVEEAELPVDRARLARAYLVQVGVGVAAEIEDMARWIGRRPAPEAFEASTWFLRQVGLSQTALALHEAREAAQEAGRQMAAFHERFDLLLTPTLAHPPVRLGALALKPVERLGLGLLRRLPLRPALHAALDSLARNSFERSPNTQLFNQTGQPAISLPLHQSAAGLPIGVQLAAAMGREDRLIRVAAQLEAAAPWAGRRPRVYSSPLEAR